MHKQGLCASAAAAPQLQGGHQVTMSCF